MGGIEDDLKFAAQSEVAVELKLLTGRELLTGVYSVDEDDRTVSVWAPQHFGDRSTRQRLRIDDIMSVTVTNVEYKMRDEGEAESDTVD